MHGRETRGYLKRELAGKKKLTTQIVSVSLQLINLVPISVRESSRELNSGVPFLSLKFAQRRELFVREKDFLHYLCQMF